MSKIGHAISCIIEWYIPTRQNNDNDNSMDCFSWFCFVSVLWHLMRIVCNRGWKRSQKKAGNCPLNKFILLYKPKTRTINALTCKQLVVIMQRVEVELKLKLCLLKLPALVRYKLSQKKTESLRARTTI